MSRKSGLIALIAVGFAFLFGVFVGLNVKDEYSGSKKDQPQGCNESIDYQLVPVYLFHQNNETSNDGEQTKLIILPKEILIESTESENVFIISGTLGFQNDSSSQIVISQPRGFTFDQIYGNTYIALMLNGERIEFEEPSVIESPQLPLASTIEDYTCLESGELVRFEFSTKFVLDLEVSNLVYQKPNQLSVQFVYHETYPGPVIQGRLWIPQEIGSKLVFPDVYQEFQFLSSNNLIQDIAALAGTYVSETTNIVFP